jgi:glycosyltransferase involved in cell wall biosynthesis
MPMFLLESMAAGCAPIGSTVGAIPELLADGCGSLVSPGSISELTATMAELIREREICETTARLARAKAMRDFNFDELMDDLEEMWMSTLKVARFRDA